MFGELNQNEIAELLNEELVGRIGCQLEGTVYVFPISYAYDGTYVYCHAFEGMKMQAMRQNPNICFQVDNTKDLTNWKSVIAWGKFEELPAGKERNDAIKILESRKLPILSSETMHLGDQWPFGSATDGGLQGIVFRILLQNKTGRFEKGTSNSFLAG
jgi:nitroimidazol reductase NimA-like FMN-containing flavoprotein (pyridoxamine 5'-phosphate oxidase superfamily)